MNSASQILIYFDAGVSYEAFEQLVRALRQDLPEFYRIKAVDHCYFTENKWEEDTTLVVIPGGRDTPYHAKLSGKPNQRIADYVKQGGVFLGLCAGGYYGSAEIEFEKGHEFEICVKRELGFFPGKAVGPAYGPGKYKCHSELGSQVAQIQWNRGRCQLYFNGGCFFDQAESYPDVEVLARFMDLPGTPAAIVACTVGKGKALLTGVHPEYKAVDLKEISKAYKEHVYQGLLHAEMERRVFWKYLIDYLLSDPTSS